MIPCPSCGAGMTALTLDGQLGTHVEIDLCSECQMIWFDHLKDLRLSTAGTLGLFRIMGDRSHAAPSPPKEPLKCPRCGLRLLPTQDRQRNTPFRYWRCPREQGRLITFLDFLREKDFIRPLSPAQLAELRRNIQAINCSSCGAPIDLVNASACAHCGAPISMLDIKQIQQLTAGTGQKGTGSAPPEVALAIQSAGSAGDEHQIRALFELLRAQDAPDRTSPFGLLEAGLWTLSKWLG